MDVLQYITFKRLVTPVWQQELFLVLWCKRQSWVLWKKICILPPTFRDKCLTLTPAKSWCKSKVFTLVV